MEVCPVFWCLKETLFAVTSIPIQITISDDDPVLVGDLQPSTPEKAVDLQVYDSLSSHPASVEDEINAKPTGEKYLKSRRLRYLTHEKSNLEKFDPAPSLVLCKLVLFSSSSLTYITYPQYTYKRS
jgi:hypothetical protein